MELEFAQSEMKAVIRCIYSSAIYFPARYLYFVVSRTHSVSIVPPNFSFSNHECKQDAEKTSDRKVDLVCRTIIDGDALSICGCCISAGCNSAKAGGYNAADGCDLQDRDRCDDR